MVGILQAALFDDQGKTTCSSCAQLLLLTIGTIAAGAGSDFGGGPTGPGAGRKKSTGAETGGPSCNSFSPETPVLMADGTTKPISDVQVGDTVTATDPETEETAGRPVTELHRNIDTDLTDLTLGTATPDNTKPLRGGHPQDPETTPEPAVLHTTPRHRFWNATTQAWTHAADLQPGHQLIGPAGQTTYLLATHHTTGPKPMHDLTVATTHTYYVLAGNTPVLVHNCPDDIPAGPKYENPGHHDPRGGPNPYNPNKAVLPGDASAQFGNSVLVDGTRWTKIGTGRSAVYYRYFDDGNGNWHWSGSTNGVNNRGVQVSIPLDQVPISVRRS